jgi:hypothetical protein
VVVRHYAQTSRLGALTTSLFQVRGLIMKYMLLIYGNEQARANLKPEARAPMFAAYGAYTDALRKAGAYVTGDPLQLTATATTVRGAGSKAQVIDGPFAETKEQLAGFYMIDVPDLDSALQWARRCPGTDGGAVEIRPVMAIPA